MAAFGTKLRTVAGGRLAFWCPGCDTSHHVGVEPPAPTIWSFNGNSDAPTFRPSVLVTYDRYEPPVTRKNIDEYRRKPWPQKMRRFVCHSFITDGRIQFLPDCTHKLAGQTVPLPDWPGVPDE